MKRIYLDYNATTPLTDGAKAALVTAFDSFGNPSSVHSEGRAAKALMQRARRQVAALVNADPENIVFTSGATEAAATLLTPDYFMGRTPLALSHLYFSATEHPCITAKGRFPAEKCSVIPVDGNGFVQPVVLQDILARHDKAKGLPLVAIQYANHETGVIQPIAELAAIVRQAGGLFIVDSVQYAGRKKLDITQNCGDFFILSAHKLGGPKGAGAFIAAGGLVMPGALITGGGQERGLRSGTQALPLIAAFGAAAADAQANLPDSERLAGLRNDIEAGIRKIAPDVLIHGEAAPRLPNTSYFTVPDIPAETLQIAFDLEGIAVSAGSACSSGKVSASPVLKAMGLENQGAVRLSSGWNTQSADIERFLTVFKNIMMRKK
ncbi:MAG: Aminotransferase class V [Candidatus Tokpelaia hoelldobleri]|uniref:Cysteine desulfurase n=1 Tax=Candidatus Tokpelaia hoelldobleri TaxID=1902579 RepID=A0A1U9JUU9_9HYPH|nr:MAG: Aminotransferase class V [Candidatus Tokpelaia hoelldoblerii]